MNLPKRKQLRLPDYDYSAPGAYFVTICTHEIRCILSTITVGDGFPDVPNTVTFGLAGRVGTRPLRIAIMNYES